MGEAFLESLLAVLGERRHSFYLYGAVTFPHPPSWHLDLDYHALVSERPSPDDIGRITAARDASGDEHDGYFLLLADAYRSTNPRCTVFGATDDAWPLHRAHILAGRVRVLHGADPRSIVARPEWIELATTLDDELEYVHANMRHAAYCTLNLCRLLYSWTTRDVVTSKYAAAHWTSGRLPQWSAVVDAALRQYQRGSLPGDAELLAADAPRLLAFCEAEIAGLRG